MQRPMYDKTEMHSCSKPILAHCDIDHELISSSRDLLLDLNMDMCTKSASLLLLQTLHRHIFKFWLIIFCARQFSDGRLCACEQAY